MPDISAWLATATAVEKGVHSPQFRPPCRLARTVTRWKSNDTGASLAPRDQPNARRHRRTARRRGPEDEGNDPVRRQRVGGASGKKRPAESRTQPGDSEYRVVATAADARVQGGTRGGCSGDVHQPDVQELRHGRSGKRKTQSNFKCVRCGHTGNADVNAALNIMASATGAAGRRGALALATPMNRQNVCERRAA